MSDTKNLQPESDDENDVNSTVQLPELRGKDFINPTEKLSGIDPEKTPPAPTQNLLDSSGQFLSSRRASPSATESVRIQLIHMDSELQPISVKLMGETTIGRGLEADISLARFNANIQGVSRTHAKFDITLGMLFVEDMNSVNGTSVNGNQLKSGVPTKLKTDDMIIFGMLRFRIKIKD